MKILGRMLTALAVALVTAWCTAALRFGPAQSLPLALAMAACGTFALVSVFARRQRRLAAPLFIAALVAFLVHWTFFVRPSNERQWQPEVARLASAGIDGDLVTIRNIRNFRYRSETDFDVGYYDKTFRISDLDSIDILASYWMGDAIAHVMASFGFAGGRDYLTISIETRKEQGEGYSTIEGFFRRYELYYVVADERDLIGVRTNHRKDPPEQVYLYRVQGPIENLRRVFLDYLREINELESQPKWYNTATTNCTTSILTHARMNPNRPPMSWKILLSGYVPEYLYELGRLDRSLSFEELKKRSLLNPAANAAGDGAADFSQKIRAGIPGIAASRQDPPVKENER